MSDVNDLTSIGFTESQATRIMKAIQKRSGIIAVVSANDQERTQTYQVIADIAKSISPSLVVIDNIFDTMKLGKAMHDIGAPFHALTALSATHLMGAFTYISHMCREDLAANQLSCVVYQKLLPVTCKHCRIHASETQKESDHEGHILSRLQSASMSLENIYFRNHEGCSRCNHTGYEKRMLCAEVLLTDGAIFESLVHNDMDGINKARRNLRGGNIADDDHGYGAEEIALHRMQQGLFDPIDVEDIFGFAIGSE